MTKILNTLEGCDPSYITLQDVLAKIDDDLRKENEDYQEKIDINNEILDAIAAFEFQLEDLTDLDF